MIANLKELESKYGALEFIYFGFHGRAFFRIIQTGEIIAVSERIIEKGSPKEVAQRLKEAFPLNNSAERTELIAKIRTSNHQYALVS
jgi:hypothetical protein